MGELIFDQPRPNPAELAEARRILADLLAIHTQLKPGDRRFVEIRAAWLVREGAAARWAVSDGCIPARA